MPPRGNGIPPCWFLAAARYCIDMDDVLAYSVIVGYTEFISSRSWSFFAISLNPVAPVLGKRKNSLEGLISSEHFIAYFKEIEMMGKYDFLSAAIGDQIWQLALVAGILHNGFMKALIARIQRSGLYPRL